MKSEYVASCGFGKDSLAMVLNLIERNAPLDEVIFYDTGMEFDSIYRNRDKLIPILERHGIQFTELKPDNPFLYDMLERPVFSKQKGNHSGYGWCGGVCRWGTTWKTKTIDTYVEGAKVHYIGIAADEPERLNRLLPPKNAPLFIWGMTEKDALQYCYEHGWNWLEHTHTHKKLNYIQFWIVFHVGAAQIKTARNYITSIVIFLNIGIGLKIYKRKLNGL